MSRRVKGTGSIFQRKSDNLWCYQVDLGWKPGPNGKRIRDRRTRTAPTLKALRPKIAALDEELRVGLDADGSMTVERWLNWWHAEIAPNTAKSPRTLATYRGYLDNWIIPHLGARRLNQLKPDHLRALYRTMANEGKTPSTIRQVHAITSAALKVAENDGKILKSPARSVTPPGTGEKGSHGKLTRDEFTKVMRVLANRPDRARWYAALLLGLRQGEALGLAWADIDQDNNLIHIRHSLGRVTGEGLWLDKVKSDASRRVLPLLPELRAALRDIPRDSPGKRTFHVAARIRKDFDTLPCDDDLVWGPLDNKHDYNQWQSLLEAAGVQHHPLHAARATTASILDELGYSPKLIAEILGHAQASTTSNNYIHGDMIRRNEALGGLAGLIEPSTDSGPGN